MRSNSPSLPLAFLLAMSAEAGAAPPAADAAAPLRSGSLAPLLRAAPADLATAYDPAKPENGVTVDPATRTVQWFNWPNWSNWFNCFNGVWRNC